MAVSVKAMGFVKSSKWKDYLEKFINVRGSRVEVGFLPDGPKYDDGTPVAFVAGVHEFGSDNVPQRPFIRSTVNNKGNEWSAMVNAYLKENGVEKTLEMLGEAAHRDMQNTIEEFIPPPLAKETIRRKTKKGNGNPTLPLVDTGLMIKSISYRVIA